ncbi:uncharacterized protein STEHIDRAFT_132828 [Stereum hirsutum FP-91666 SS1]|uniref:uncharacterized protein n=1 Tax=Stereum hirsutum (strain FP-91666) TaxID=721885 RepID=UPI0004449C1C|nr:uncharacterized protein STEHIDRAFT_132828 [Stereum hirsutum FP-91666 SS1]EIM84555.1 hypothetical protein STEHIDRAFT_132828 [Stereum hirsutum FP-91666 SS1]
MGNVPLSMQYDPESYSEIVRQRDRFAIAQLSSAPSGPSSSSSTDTVSKPKLTDLPLITVYSPESIAHFQQWFPELKFIAKASWNKSPLNPKRSVKATNPDERQAVRGPSQASQDLNRQAAFMEGPDGELLGGQMVLEVRSFHRTCFKDLKDRGEATWLFTDLSETVLTRLCEESAKRFPTERLCVDGWKARELMRLAWPGWAKENLKDLKPDAAKRWKGKARAKETETDAKSVDQPLFAAEVVLDLLLLHVFDGLERIPAKEEDNISLPAVVFQHPTPRQTALPLDIVLDPLLLLETPNPGTVANAAPNAEEPPASDAVSPDTLCTTYGTDTYDGSLTCATQPGATVPEGASGTEQTSKLPTPTAPSKPSTTAFSSAVFKPLHHTPLPTSIAGPSTAHGDASSPPTKASHMSKQPKETKPKLSAADLPIYPRENNVTGRELQPREWLDSQEVGATKARFNAYFGTVTKEVTKKAQGVKCLGEWVHPKYK